MMDDLGVPDWSCKASFPYTDISNENLLENIVLHTFVLPPAE